MRLRNWLKGIKESETVELKPSLSQINEIMETITAFANTAGGKIVIGVSKNPSSYCHGKSRKEKRYCA